MWLGGTRRPTHEPMSSMGTNSPLAIAEPAAHTAPLQARRAAEICIKLIARLMTWGQGMWGQLASACDRGAGANMLCACIFGPICLAVRRHASPLKLDKQDKLDALERNPGCTLDKTRAPRTQSRTPA